MLERLEELTLGKNYFETVPDLAFRGLRKLRSLDLSECPKLRRVAARALEAAPMLEEISLRGAPLGGTGTLALAPALSTCASLHTLNLGSCRVGDAGARALAKHLLLLKHVGTLSAELAEARAALARMQQLKTKDDERCAALQAQRSNATVRCIIARRWRFAAMQRLQCAVLAMRWFAGVSCSPGVVCTNVVCCCTPRSSASDSMQLQRRYQLQLQALPNRWSLARCLQRMDASVGEPLRTHSRL